MSYELHWHSITDIISSENASLLIKHSSNDDSEVKHSLETEVSLLLAQSSQTLPYDNIRFSLFSASRRMPDANAAVSYIHEFTIFQSMNLETKR